ncbi:hypothetical protein MYX84_14130, partial [Acidobacteria bacterium AH-259-O06]|nr:hypothetical protein [Acidobacteria bacterium AH-259-O06]
MPKARCVASGDSLRHIIGDRTREETEQCRDRAHQRLHGGLDRGKWSRQKTRGFLEQPAVDPGLLAKPLVTLQRAFDFRDGSRVRLEVVVEAGGRPVQEFRSKSTPAYPTDPGPARLLEVNLNEPLDKG